MSDDFGPRTIGKDLFDIIRELLPVEKTILELGSGKGTEALKRHYEIYSVEHDEKWLNMYHTNYIYAPLKPHKELKNHPSSLWYDVNVLKRELPKIDYDLLLIDGPPGNTRAGVVKYWDIFKHNVPIVIDDLQRFRDYRITLSLSNKLNLPFTVYGADGDNKPFGVLIP